jgi:Zn-dependent protease with chaperone function
MAFYGLISLTLSILVAIAWRFGLARMCSSSRDFLALRLLPAGGATLLTLTVVLPSFVVYEPGSQIEEAGPFLMALVFLVLIIVSAGIVRAGRAVWAARALLQSCGSTDHWCAEDGQRVDLIDIAEPIVAVVGGWRPQIVAARQVFVTCSSEEFRQVIAHEAAHVSSRDNLKLLVFLISPDALAWLPSGVALAARWRAAAEFEADERATGSDPRKRVALASALTKVARLSTGARRPLPALSMPVALDDMEGRVRQLLSLSPRTTRRTALNGVVTWVAVLPLIAVPLYGHVHQFIEALVALGR